MLLIGPAETIPELYLGPAETVAKQCLSKHLLYVQKFMAHQLFKLL